MTAQFKLTIHQDQRAPSENVIPSGAYSIGSDADNRIILPDSTVGDRHAILTVNDRGCWVEDLDTETGTHIDGQSVAGRAELRFGSRMTIGRYDLVLSPAESTTPPPEPAAPEPAPEPVRRETPARPPVANARDRQIKRQIHVELLQRLDLKRLTAASSDEEDLHRRAEAAIQEIITEISDRLPPDIAPAQLAKEVYDEAVGLGPLEPLLDDPEVTEIMVNGANQVYVEKDGKLELSDRSFLDDTSVLAIIERIISPIGRRIDESQPYVDARLKDGSRVNAIIHPLSLIGPCLTIRKFAKTPFTDDDLCRFGTMTPQMADFIRICVQLRKNIVVSGGTGSGKTTLLNVISGYLPHTERIVTIEDAAELRLGQPHVIRLESRPPNIEGKGAVTIRDLVRNALRMRPDRIIVGECRGGEALDMLQAMNTGHDGSLTTVHANSPRDAIARLETMVLMSGMDLPIRAIREQITSAVDVIIQQSRVSDGSRKITRIAEVVGLEGEQPTMQDIFEFKQTGLTPEHQVLGSFAPTGAVPAFIEDVATKGLSIDHDMFSPGRR